MEYQFDRYRLNPQKKLLYRDNELIEAEPRVVVLLHLLLRRYPETVTRRELLEALWPRQEVSDWSLSQLIRRTRQLLQDDSRNPTYIKTIHGVGLRFLVDPVLAETPPLTPPVAPAPWYKARVHWLWSLPMLLLLLASFGWMKYQDKPLSKKPLMDIESYPYTIALLPIENNSANPGHSWVELGLMDMLNQLLGESAGIMTLDTRNVLAYLKNTPLAVTLSDPENLEQAFNSICPALGCQILVAVRLDEASNGARLSYQLATAKGVHPVRMVSGNTVLKAASGMAQEITRRIDPARPWVVDTNVSYSADEAANRAFAMGSQELFTGEPKAAVQYLRIALDKDPDFLWAQVRLADARYRSNELDTSEQLIARLLSRDNLAPDIRYQALRIHSNLLYSQGKLMESRKVSEQLLELARTSGNLIDQGTQLMHIGTSFQASGDNAGALDHLSSAESLYRQAGYKPGIGNVLFNIGNVHTGLTDYPKAALYYEQAELIFQQLGNHQYLAMARFQQANLLKSTGKLAEARNKLRDLLPMFEKLGDTEGVALAQVDMARIDMMRGQIDEGIASLEKLLPSLQARKLEYVEYLAHNYLADAYLSKHQPLTAREHIQFDSEFQTNDPDVSLLPARLALEEHKFADALSLALQAKAKAGNTWKPAHEELLTQIGLASKQQEQPGAALNGSQR